MKVHIKEAQRVTVQHTCGHTREYVVAGKKDVNPTIAWKSGVICPDCDPINIRAAALPRDPLHQEMAARYAQWAATIQ